jgi:tetratricopeptide (TPR) repeat protein
LATKINHPLYQMRALLQKGYIAESRGAYDECILHHRAAQKLAQLDGKITEEFQGLAGEAAALCHLGNFPEAQVCAAQSYELLINKGYEGSEWELIVLDTMVEIHWQKAEYTEARQLTERMVQMTSQDQSPHFHANSVNNRVQLDLITGMDDAVVLRNLAAARELATELRFHLVTQMCDLSQAELDLRNAERMRSYATFQKWGRQTESAYYSATVYRSLANLGELSNNLCGLEKTFQWVTTYFAFSRRNNHLGHTYQALRYLGDILLAQGDEQTAMNIFQAVLDASTEMDVHRRRADCMSRIGDIWVRRGEPENAKDMWEMALPLFVRSSQANDAAAIEMKLDQPARRDLDAHSEFPRPVIFPQQCLAGIAPVEELD